jgi:medium-chain acyl-[acyl-carrier-protein] hydrolase
MEQVWKERFEIKSYCVDFQQILKPSVLLQFFQEAASNHAEQLGGGYQALAEKGLFWVLSRLRTEITRMPGWGETIFCETWPANTEGLQFRRDFLIYDTDHNIIIRAVSGWLLVNSANLRPQRISALGINLSGNDGKRSLDHFPERLNIQTKEISYRKKIFYNEIDQNLHVNNSQYLDWVTNCFDLNHFENYSLSAFSIEFLSETHCGDEVVLHIENNNLISNIEVVDHLLDKDVFKAKLEWEIKEVNKLNSHEV